MHPATVYVLFVVLHAFGMGVTVVGYVPFLQQLGLSFSDVSLLNALFFLSVLVMEVPTGLMADGRGRAWSIQMGSGCCAMGAVVYACAWGFLSALSAEILIGIGLAFLSGAQQAWMTDALHRQNELHRLRQVFGSAALGRACGMLGGGWIVSLVSESHLRWTWVWSAVIFTMCALFAARYLCGRGEPIHRVSERVAWSASWNLLRTHRPLQWAAGAAMCWSLVIPFNHFWSPFFRARAGWDALGNVWILLFGSLGIAGFIVRRLSRTCTREAVFFIGAQMLSGITLAVVGFSSGIVVPLVLVSLHEIGRGIFDPCLEAFLHTRLESSHRATYASLQSLLRQLASVIVLGIVWCALRGSPSTSEVIAIVWSVCGSALFLFALLLWRFRRRFLGVGSIS